MSELWSDRHKFALWQNVELAICRAQQETGLVPQSDYQILAQKSLPVDPDRVAALDLELHHDVLAFLSAWSEQAEIKASSRFLHLGLTSSDLIDTALCLQIRDALRLLLTDLAELEAIVAAEAKKYYDTPMAGRSHGVLAEPITFGHKLAGWCALFSRAKAKLNQAFLEAGQGMFSGPVGTHSSLDPAIEERACQILGLEPAQHSTQVIARDLHFSVIFALTNLGCAIESCALELRHLQRTEVLEVEEPFYTGQKGSSSMPHKRNPWRSENLCGLARLLRGNLLAASENVALWHERDISHSSVERVIFPDSFQLTHFMVRRLKSLVAGWQVHPQNMLKNLEAYGGIVYSQRALLALVSKGMSREEAYKLVQGISHSQWNRVDGDFATAFSAEPAVRELLSEIELTQIFDRGDQLRHIGSSFERLGLV